MGEMFMHDYSKRIVCLDVLRMPAVFGVIIIQTTAMLISEYPETSGAVWKSLNGINGLGRFAVPVFIMLTGGLLLNEERYAYIL